MKAYKQITFYRENRLIWSYSATMVLLALFLMIRPVLAQDEDNTPEIKIDVNKEYDEQGNLVRVDSIKTWRWSDKEYSIHGFDSIWDGFDEDINQLLPRNFGPFGYNGPSPGPPLHGFWNWNGTDSTAYPYFDDLFGEDFLDSLLRRPFLAYPFDLNQHFWIPDSMDYSYFDDPRLNEFFNGDFHERMEELQEQLDKLHREHQHLLEKYFGEPFRPGDQVPRIHQDKYLPSPAPPGDSNSGKI